VIQPTRGGKFSAQRRFVLQLYLHFKFGTSCRTLSSWRLEVLKTVDGLGAAGRGAGRPGADAVPLRGARSSAASELGRGVARFTHAHEVEIRAVPTYVIRLILDEVSDEVHT